MKNLIRKLLGPSQPSSSTFNDGQSMRDDPLTIEDGSDNAIRRQLIQMLLRDVMRLHGIPQRSIECQMLVVTSKSRGPGMYVRLVIREWDERMLKYAFAFQTALLADILRFEPRAVDWLHGISWQLELNGSCPYPALPEPSYWTVPAATRGTPKHVHAASEDFAATANSFAATAPLDEPEHVLARPATRSAQSAKGTVQVSEQDAMMDLERLFFDRDQEIGNSAHAVGYEKTQPAPLL